MVNENIFQLRLILLFRCNQRQWYYVVYQHVILHACLILFLTSYYFWCFFYLPFIIKLPVVLVREWLDFWDYLTSSCYNISRSSVCIVLCSLILNRRKCMAAPCRTKKDLLSTVFWLQKLTIVSINWQFMYYQLKL